MTNDEMKKIVEENIDKLEKKDFTIFFFVLDTKGNPSSSAEYIYQTAYALQEMGYKVKMLHQEKDFVGVGDWLGEKYANLPHANVEKENVDISASDFLFIPEVLANVMMQTKNLPCKRAIVVQNTNNITEFMPVSQTLENLSIIDAIVTTKVQEERLKSFFPEVRTHIVSPSIKKVFRKNTSPRKLLINVISKDQSVVNRIVKPFYWKNPVYKFVSFRDLRGVTQEVFADALREGAITVWADDDTTFGYTLLEALRCGGLVFAKVPDEPSDWMLDKDGNLIDSVIWFDTTDELHDMLSTAVRSWTRNEIPQEIYDSADKLSEYYTEEIQNAEIEQAYVKEIITRRLNEFKEILGELENNEKTEEE